MCLQIIRRLERVSDVKNRVMRTVYLLTKQLRTEPELCIGTILTEKRFKMQNLHVYWD